jgi:intracellular proteinase inhibitor BsuPI
MNIRVAIALASVGALAFACSPRSRPSSQNSKPAALASALPLKTTATGEIVERSERPKARPSQSSKGEQKLDSHLDVTVQPRAIQFALGVKNIGKKHVELTFRSGQSYDFVVVDSIGREVWRWSAGRMFTQGVQNKQLSSGDSMHAREIWAAPAPGRYTAIATLNSTNFPTEQRADFVVP